MKKIVPNQNKINTCQIVKEYDLVKYRTN